MRIKCLTTFLDGKDRYEQDDLRTVDDERGAYFVAQGWAIDTGGTTLDVHGAVSGTGDSNG